MSYIFLPPRTDNFFPPGMPYLAGLHGMRGLGDYAADYKAYQLAVISYNRNMKIWNAKKASFDADVAAYNNAVSSVAASYATAQGEYQRDLAAWNNEYSTYTAALAAWKTQCAQIVAANKQRATAIAQAYGITLPQWFIGQGYCATQAQINSYAVNCSTVKGLGYLRGLGSSDPNCGWKGMPICSFPSPPTIRSKPTAPAAPAYPAKPVLPAQPVAPVAPVKPAAVPTPTPAPGGGYVSTKTPKIPTGPALVPTQEPEIVPVAEPAKNAGMMRNGLILVALGVGGYLVYRTLKKPKAQAA